MLKNKIVFEHKIGEKTYELICPPDPTWAEIFDVGCVIRSTAAKQINEILEKDKDAAKTQG